MTTMTERGRRYVDDGSSGWLKGDADPLYSYGGVAEQKEWAVDRWESGAIRDSQRDKPRYDLIDPGFLARLAEVMRLGAEHYGEFNWTKGIPSQRYMASLLRHVFAYYSGDRSEDHLAAAAFNLQGLMRTEGSDLDDLFNWQR